MSIFNDWSELSDTRKKVWAFGSAIFLSLAIGSKSKMTSLHADNSVSTKWNPLKVWASTIHSTPSKWSASIITNTFNWNNQCLNICLLLGMTGHVSSAKAPDRLSCSNSFLHIKRNDHRLRKLPDPLCFGRRLSKGFCAWHTCHHGLGLPNLHHEKWHSMDLLESGEKLISDGNFVKKLKT
jgi:hypothetical protein